MSLTIKDDDAAFRWVKEWFLDQQFLKRIRRLDVDTTLRGREARTDSRAGLSLVLAFRPSVSRRLSIATRKPTAMPSAAPGTAGLPDHRATSRACCGSS